MHCYHGKKNFRNRTITITRFIHSRRQRLIKISRTQQQLLKRRRRPNGGQQRTKQMKAHLLFTNIFAAIGVMGLICACQTTTTATGSSAPAQKETMLTQAGFKSYTVTTAQQKQHLSKLPAGK